MMKFDKYKNPILSVDEGKKALLYGGDIEGAFFDDEEEVRLFQQYGEKVLGQESRILNPISEDEDPIEYHARKARDWNIPAKYKEELVMFKERNLVPLLQFLIYIVDYMREQRIVWGVGRGSSVASYCLYLIGVHKVDSIVYDLPIEEFLK